MKFIFNHNYSSALTAKMMRFVAVFLFSMLFLSPASANELSHEIVSESIENHQLSIPYSVSGHGNTAVIFIHGFMDAGNVWEPVISKLHAQDYQFVTLDLPFMGAMSTMQGQVSLETISSAVTGVVDKLDMPVILVGQSMGAQIAELVANARPEKVKGIVFVAPVPLSGLPVSEEFMSSMQAMANNETLQRQFRQQQFSHIDPATLEKIVVNGTQITAKNIVELINAWSKGHPAGSKPALSTAPVLIIGGADDPVCTPEVLTSLVSPRFALETTIFLPEAGHWLHIDHSDDVAKEIDHFLVNIQ
ncbi:alpha/beta fold hydrolase [Zophobihabitans entericus]|uniref:Alpha/beta hydrolase n=1 Tax=Zophobihabitans entericus TaxID=1635327 RepID=A0A6G9IB19_9GAMM|nr:alpha/beta hydrolase [Zophobihabitans entericus]QIQ21421.1 alpha/beta hydrolase [Zophobihabitans entericus]